MAVNKKPFCFERGVQIDLRHNSLFGKQRRKDGPVLIRRPMEKACKKERTTKLRKGKGMSVKFAFLATSGNEPIIGEVSGGQVNLATRQVNLSDISGEMPGETKLAR